MKKRMLAAVLAAMTLAAGAAMADEKDGGRKFIEQTVVPMARANDTAQGVCETFTNDELVAIRQALEESGMKCADLDDMIAAGEGDWEEEVIMSLARETFGSVFYQWTAEQKWWFEEQAVAIGYKEKNPMLAPGEDDMTEQEAKAHAAQLLAGEFGVTLPTEDDETWEVAIELHAPYTDEEGEHPALWSVGFMDRASRETVYTVSFTREGELNGATDYTPYLKP